jgi:hypothetical protein
MPCPIAGRPASWRTPMQLSPPSHVGLPTPWRSPAGPQNPALPLRNPPRDGIFLPLALLVPQRASPATARQSRPQNWTPWSCLPPAARAQVAILPLTRIKAPPEAPELAAPNPTPTSRHLHVDVLLCPHIAQTNTPSPSPPHSEAAQLVPTPSPSLEHRHHHPQPPPALCQSGEPPWSTTSPPKATIRCGLVPSCLSHPRPSLPATLVAGIWPGAAIPLHKGPNCFNFNISREISIKWPLIV